MASNTLYLPAQFRIRAFAGPTPPDVDRAVLRKFYSDPACRTAAGTAPYLSHFVHGRNSWQRVRCGRRRKRKNRRRTRTSRSSFRRTSRHRRAAVRPRSARRRRLSAGPIDRWEGVRAGRLAGGTLAHLHAGQQLYIARGSARGGEAQAVRALRRREVLPLPRTIFASPPFRPANTSLP